MAEEEQDLSFGRNGDESFGREPTSLGPTSELPYPQRHKVPLPIPSLKEELKDALESLRALLAIPSQPLKKFKGKSWRTKLFLASSAILPPVEWLSTYKKEYVTGDILAGLTVWSLVPEDMGYAQLANLPVECGLYASLLPPLAYVLLGTSRHLCVGPTPLLALMLGSLCSYVFDPLQEPASYISLMASATFFAGIFTVLFGILRLGFVADLLSHAAILGFLAGASVITIVIELAKVLGYTSPILDYSIVYLVSFLIKDVSEFNWRSFVIGLVFFIFLQMLKFLARKYREHPHLGQPLRVLCICGPVISLAIATLCVYLTGVYKPPANVPTVERISDALSTVFATARNVITGPKLAGAVGIGVLVGLTAYAESIAISRTFAAAAGRYRINPNKEMVAVGAMNVVSALTAGLVVGGSFPRSALAFSSGARTQLFSVLMSVGVLITIVALPAVIDYIPVAVLAAIIISAVLDLIRIPSIMHIWRTDKTDFLVFLATFLAILFIGIGWGLVVAVLAAGLKLLIPVSRPPIRVLGLVPGTGIYMPVEQYRVAEQTEGVLALSVFAPLVFSNAKFVKESIQEKLEDIAEISATPVQLLVLDFTPVCNIDTTGLHALFELIKAVGTTQVRLANPSQSVLRKLVASGFFDALGPDFVFFSVYEAVQLFVFTKTQTDSFGQSAEHSFSIGEGSSLEAYSRSASLAYSLGRRNGSQAEYISSAHSDMLN